MSKNWDYAKLSKLASENGGPQKFVDSLISNSKSSGKSDMIPWIIGISAGASAITAIIVKIIDNIRKKKTEKELAVLKQELIKGIEDYDKEHSQSSEEIIADNDNQES